MQSADQVAYAMPMGIVRRQRLSRYSDAT
jgi:hypothetical protein